MSESPMPKHLIERPYRVKFAAVGIHNYTGDGWVVREFPIVTTAGEPDTAYLVRLDEPKEDGGQILLGGGEILERGRPVEWADS